jgi:type IV secretory pathway ATPase VirB11/archaellum biosynthesis ATPase
MKRGTSYLEPFSWWGPVWSPPNLMSLDDLIAAGTLSTELAALLKTLMGYRASIVVAAGPSNAGKTTLLTALLDHLPDPTTRIYVRGCYEPFDFLAENEPATSALLINEISPHLPIYLWGPGVRRIFEAAKSGYQLAATAHATSVEDFVYSLTNYPLRIPSEHVRTIDLLVLLDVFWQEGRPVRRVNEVVSLSADANPGSIHPVRIAWRNSDSDDLEIDNEAVNDLLERLD